MSMTARAFSDFFKLPQWVSDTLYLDLGSASTRVMVGNKLVFNQPTCLTYHPTTQTVVEIGKPAARIFDKQPGSVQVYFPILKGAVTQPTIAQLYIQAVLKQVFQDQKRLPIIFGLSGRVSIPSLMTPVERSTLLNVLSKAGLTQVTLIPKVKAIHQTLSAQGIAHHHLCIVDIGASTTEVGLFVGDECVSSTTLWIGGDYYTDEVIALAKDEYEAEIGWQTAEKLKHGYRTSLSGKNSPRTGEYKVTTRGKHIVTGVPTTISLSATAVNERFDGVSKSLLKELRLFLAQAPAELLTSALEDGIYFTGGGSLLPGVVELLSQELKSHFTLSKHPMEDSVRGLAFSK